MKLKFSKFLILVFVLLASTSYLIPTTAYAALCSAVGDPYIITTLGGTVYDSNDVTGDIPITVGYGAVLSFNVKTFAESGTSNTITYPVNNDISYTEPSSGGRNYTTNPITSNSNIFIDIPSQNCQDDPEPYQGFGALMVFDITVVNPTGVITASNCTIPNGASTCNSNLSWNTVNPSGTSSVTTPTNITVATGNSGPGTYPVAFGTRTFYLYNSGSLLDQATSSATCAAGTNFNSTSGTCVAQPAFSVSSPADSGVLLDNGLGDGKNITTYTITVSGCQNLSGPVTFSNPNMGSITGVATSFVGGKNTATCNAGDNTVTIRATANANPSPLRSPSSTTVDQMIITASASGVSGVQIPLGISIYGRPSVTLSNTAQSSYTTQEPIQLTWHTNYVYSSVNFNPPCTASASWSGSKNGGHNVDNTENLGTKAIGNYTFNISCPGALGTTTTASTTATVVSPQVGAVQVKYSLDGVVQSGTISATYFITDDDTGASVVPSASRSVPTNHTLPPGKNYHFNLTTASSIVGAILDLNNVANPVQYLNSSGTINFVIPYHTAAANDFALQIVSVSPVNSKGFNGETFAVTLKATQCQGSAIGATYTINSSGNPSGSNFQLNPITVTGCDVPVVSNLVTSVSTTPGPATLTFSATTTGVSGARTAQVPIELYSEYPNVVRVNPIAPNGFAPYNGFVTWSSTGIDPSRQCELYVDGIPTGENMSNYSQSTDGSGNRTITGSSWSTYYSGIGSQGWTKEISVANIKHRVHFQVSNQPQVLWVGSNATTAKSWFLGGDLPYWKINAGPSYAGKQVLWSTYAGGSTWGIRISPINQNLGITLDSNGRWEGWGTNLTAGASAYAGLYTREIKIIEPGGSASRPLASFYINYSVTNQKPILTMDKTFYSTSDSPVYTVTGAMPSTSILWSSYFNNYFHSLVDSNNSTSNFTTGSLNGGPITMSPVVYGYRVKCYGYIGTWSQAFGDLVVQTGTQASATVTYSLDGVPGTGTIPFNFHINNLDTNMNVFSGTSAPATQNLGVAGQYQFVYDNGAPAGYTFNSVTTANPAVISSPGSATFNVNFTSNAMSGTLIVVNGGCTIPDDSSNCPVTLQWNTINPVGTSSITTPTGITVPGSNINNGSTTYLVAKGTRTFFLNNNGQSLVPSSQYPNGSGVTATADCNPTSDYVGGFCRAKRIITVTQASNGTISPGTTSVVYNSNQTFSISPSSGFAVASLIIDGVTVAGASSYTFSNITADHTISATYSGGSCTNINVSSPNIYTGGKSKLTWSSCKPSGSCTGTNFNNTSAASGTTNLVNSSNATGFDVSPASTTTYTLSCTGDAPVSATVTVTRNPQIREN